MNSYTFLPAFNALILAPQSSETQFIPVVPKMSDTLEPTKKNNYIVVAGTLCHFVNPSNLSTLVKFMLTSYSSSATFLPCICISVLSFFQLLPLSLDL